jgi:multiple sugar transport system permease protein
MKTHTNRATGKTFVYLMLGLWSFVCLFPIYWTVTTSFKKAKDVMLGHMIPWVDFQPDWIGWRSLGLSPDKLGQSATNSSCGSKTVSSCRLAQRGWH